MWNVAIPIKKNILSNTKINLRVFAALMLISNRENELKGCSEENERYLYDNKVQKYMNYLSNLLNIKEVAIRRNVQLLIDYKLIVPKNSSNGLIYKLKYKASEQEFEFIKINSDILENLIRFSNLREFKLYCLIKRECNNKNQAIITQNYLCNEIGFSVHNKKNVVKSIKNLEKNSFIKIFPNRNAFRIASGEKTQVAFTNHITYEIINYKGNIDG